MPHMPYMRKACDESESDFRASLRAYQDEFSAKFLDAGLKPIRHITVVGANRPLPLLFEGTDEDSKRVASVLHYMKKTGLWIDPDFELDRVDFIDGRDFLKEEQKTDMVFVSCILKEPVQGRMNISDKELAFYAQQRGVKYDPTHAFTLATRLSENHTKSKWQARIEGSGAKIVWTFGGTDEVSSDYVLGASFAHVIPTPDRRIIDWRDRCETAASFYGDQLQDLPMLWLGCNIQQSAARAYHNVLAEAKTGLAQGIKTHKQFKTLHNKGGVRYARS